MRKRTEKFIAVKINSAHTKLQERITYLRVFRRNHEQLRAMTGPGGGLKALGFDTFTDVDTDEEVRQAYEGLKSAPVLDVTTGKQPLMPTCAPRLISYPDCRGDGDLGDGRELVRRKDIPSREPDHLEIARKVGNSKERARNVQDLLEIQ